MSVNPWRSRPRGAPTPQRPPGMPAAVVAALADRLADVATTLGRLPQAQPALDALTRRRMQEELLQLWEEVRFTLLFVTHSIEEALVVGNRILLLSPHPGRVRAELNAHQFGLHSQGSAEFQAAVARIHGLLFGTAAEAGPDRRVA